MLSCELSHSLMQEAHPPCLSNKKFDKTETPLAAVLAREERETRRFLPYCVCRARITGTPHGIKEVGVSEDRTSGLQLTAEETRATTAAPDHRFDGINAVCLDYEAQSLSDCLCLLSLFTRQCFHLSYLVDEHAILVRSVHSEAFRSI
jgi:hypothetical protein